MDPDRATSSLLASTLPTDFRSERNEALHRILRRLPGDLLGALIDGFDRADVIEPGRLFAGCLLYTSDAADEL